jgi:HlyD family secretion protein
VIIDPSRFEVIVDLAGSSADRVRPGQTALVTSETNLTATPTSTDVDSAELIANARAQGEVYAVNPAVSPGGRAVEAVIRLDPDTTATLQHGEQVTTWIAVAEAADAVVVRSMPLCAAINSPMCLS